RHHDDEKVVFTNAATDPYTNANQGTALLGQNQIVLNDSIGVSNYDVGHIFTRACTDVGGVAGGPVCNDGTKGRGVTCQYTNLIEIVESVMTHELGHQFSASHSWNNCPSSLGQYAASTALEPGSGSTIMSYAGLCGNQNIVFDNDLYFHGASLNQIYFFIENGGGNTCGQRIDTENMFPDLSLPYTNGFSIPKSTPFELTATASDPDGDNLSYCWEGMNPGPVNDIGIQTQNRPTPLFRSFPPTSSPTRVFPRLNTILAGTQSNAEVLPVFSRDLKFRCTVRDNDDLIGGVVWEEVNFKVAEQAGPFKVEFPNLSTDLLVVGAFLEFRWDVANTDKNPVNCQNVNILLSLDGGFTYPIALAENTPNDGSEFIVIPDQTSGSARIKVEAADNIFFDLSDENFIITAPTEPGYALGINPINQQACLPDNITIDINTFSLLDYDSLIQLEVLDGLPSGATAEFSVNPVQASQTSVLTINLQDVTVEGDYTFSLRATAPETDTIVREIQFNTVSNDYSQFAIKGPVDGSSGLTQLPEFSWRGVTAADSYEIEVSTSPAFGDSIKYSSNGIVDTVHFPNILLESNTLYYWRVRPSNSCGVGEFTEVSAFHTESLSCAIFEADNVPINISAQGTPTIESILPITIGGTVSDVNIPVFKGSHDLVKHLDVKLISPAGTEVLLFTDLCGNTSFFDIGFDDESPTDLPCPPIDRNVHKPQNALSVLDGENAQGDWKMQLEVTNTAGEGGALDAWSLELCSNVNLSSPVLVINDTLLVNPGNSRFITNEFLLTEDENNGSFELTYTLVTLPRNGKVFFEEEELVIGSQFSQGDLNFSRVRYEHAGDDKQLDDFKFTVADGEGGWLGILQFDVSIDSDFTISTKEALADTFIELFPNPASQEVTLRFAEAITTDLQLSIFDLQGRQLRLLEYDAIQSSLPRLQDKFSLNVSTLPQGVYLLRLQTSEGVLTKRLVLQRE
ncbi:MAG: cadherin-like domain-containing protein, partial [Bacteroidota bacterium]